MTYNDERPHPTLYDGPDDHLELEAHWRHHEYVSDQDNDLNSAYTAAREFGGGR